MRPSLRLLSRPVASCAPCSAALHDALYETRRHLAGSGDGSMTCASLQSATASDQPQALLRCAALRMAAHLAPQTPHRPTSAPAHRAQRARAPVTRAAMKRTPRMRCAQAKSHLHVSAVRPGRTRSREAWRHRDASERTQLWPASARARVHRAAREATCS